MGRIPKTLWSETQTELGILYFYLLSLEILPEGDFKWGKTPCAQRLRGQDSESFVRKIVTQSWTPNGKNPEPRDMKCRGGAWESSGNLLLKKSQFIPSQNNPPKPNQTSSVLPQLLNFQEVPFLRSIDYKTNRLWWFQLHSGMFTSKECKSLSWCNQQPPLWICGLD